MAVFETLVKCVDDSRNPDIGRVHSWVQKGKSYWAKNIQQSGNYQGEFIFDLFDNNHSPIVPNETYKKWRSNRFFIVGSVCLN
jgi:hypothetical protein